MKKIFVRRREKTDQNGIQRLLAQLYKMLGKYLGNCKFQLSDNQQKSTMLNFPLHFCLRLHLKKERSTYHCILLLVTLKS